ncbi:MAG: cell division topological specificity factor MinE [Bacillota bacterium]
MLEFISRILGRGAKPRSKNLAKERLKLVLAHDRIDVSPGMFEGLRVDLARAFGKYVDIDEAGMKVRFDSTDSRLAVVASAPVIGMRRGTQAPRRGRRSDA